MFLNWCALLSLPMDSSQFVLFDRFTRTFARRLRGIIICYFAYATVGISSLLLVSTPKNSFNILQKSIQ